jgi:hydrogen peroxide-dependent heme synthase
MTEPATPAEGLGVLHLFWKLTPLADREAVAAVAKRARGEGDQVLFVSMLGHKADLAVMALGADLWRLRRIQTELAAAGLELVDSYVSMTELSEYAKGLPEEMAKTRLYPQLPPAGKPAWCFYPMSKKREAEHNWFSLPFEQRKALMYEHGASGRTFAGRVLQLVTGSTGVDDFEWGVTLFAQRPDDLKEVVYTMRFDAASALYAEFGPFYTGLIADDDEVFDSVGLS